MKTSLTQVLCLSLLLAACSRSKEPPGTDAPVTAAESVARPVIAPPAPVEKPTIEARITEWRLHPDEMKQEMLDEGRVVRMRPPGEGPDRASELVVAQIQGKFRNDPALSALHIDVDVNRVVATLNGKARSFDQIGRAIAEALDTDGVSEVVSELAIETTADAGGKPAAADGS